MRRRPSTAGLLGAVVASLLFAAPAQAATTTLGFSGVTSYGTMTVNNGVNTGSLPMGTAYSGSVSYDPTPMTSGPYAGGTRTTLRFSDLTMTVGASTVHSGPGTMDVYDNLADNPSYPAGDSVYVNFTGAVAPSGPLAGADFNWIALGLLDSTGVAVSGGLPPADLAAATWTDAFTEFNYGTQGTRWGAGNTSHLQPMTPGGTPPVVEQCSGTDAVVTAFAPRVPGFLVVNGGAALLDHLWTTDLTPATVTFLGGTTTFYQAGLVVAWHGEVGADGCHLTDLTVSPTVRFATTALPAGTVGVAYAARVAAQWGVAPYAVSAGGLPPGLTFDGTTIAGTPTTAGTFSVTGTVVDAVGASATATWTLTVAAGQATTGPKLEGKATVTRIGPGYSFLVVGTTKIVWNATTVIKVNTPAGPKTAVDGSVKLGRKAQWTGRRLVGSTTVLVSRLEIG